MPGSARVAASGSWWPRRRAGEGAGVREWELRREEREGARMRAVRSCGYRSGYVGRTEKVLEEDAGVHCEESVVAPASLRIERDPHRQTLVLFSNGQGMGRSSLKAVKRGKRSVDEMWTKHMKCGRGG